MTSAAEDVLDWLHHLRVRPNQSGLYPHPGMWLTRGDYSEHQIVWWLMRFDTHVVAPIFCRLGFHRWISIRESYDEDLWETRCWYCEESHP